MSQHPLQSSLDMHAIETVVNGIFSSAPLCIEPATGGISTTVYRIIYPHETFYLRLLPDARDSFASEAAVHTRLRQMQVNVPEVIHFEHFNETLQRSVMVTTAIKGDPVIQSHTLSTDTLQEIVLEAGRDLAHINAVSVDGFGRLRGQAETEQLSGPCPTHRTFVFTGRDDAIGHLANTVLSAAEVHMLEQIVSYYDSWLESEQCYLAHGDFSGRHIFQEHGHYTGIIDFGDSKGVDGWYDLGYFHMRDGGPLLPYRLESALLRGYGEIVPLPSDYEQHICFASLLIAVTAIAHTVQNYPPDRFTQHQIKTLRHDLAALF